jgi:hypothetical protein
MFFRMSRYKLRPGVMASMLINRAEQLKPQMDTLNVRFMHTVQIGDDECCLIAAYDDEATAERALGVAKEIWAQLSDVIDTDTFQVEASDVIWSYQGSPATSQN